MRLKYFKNCNHLGDLYVGEKENGNFDFMNIVAIDKDYFYTFANDESSNYSDGRISGLYRFMKVEKTDFEELKDLARNKNREKGITLINKFHRENPVNLNVAYIEGNLDNGFNRPDKTMIEYYGAQPILE